MSVAWLALAIYLVARIGQLWADRLPSLFLVLLHVLPPAIFAILHGSILYGRRGIAIFTVCCLGVAGFFELLSLRTGFPFGHYYFTDVMGPKFFGLPFLLVLAYLGIGYCSWVLALLILGYRDKPLAGVRTVAVPVLAAFLMLAWDLAMDPAWSTFDHAWIWQRGGAIYGVPVSNFLGWYLTAYLFFQSFARFCRRVQCPVPRRARSFWIAPVLLYLVCAVGNLFLLGLPHAAPMVTDATGRRWATADIFGSCAVVSLLVMTPLALLAWTRLVRTESGNGRPRTVVM